VRKHSTIRRCPGSRNPERGPNLQKGPRCYSFPCGAAAMDSLSRPNDKDQRSLTPIGLCSGRTEPDGHCVIG
jgi:hypothetical protein